MGALAVQIFPDGKSLARSASLQAAALIRQAIGARGRARIIVGTGNSQDDLIDALIKEPDLNWTAVEVFHLDEYVGMPTDHPASFRRWLKTRLADKVGLKAVHYLAGDAVDLECEMRRYADLLAAEPVDLCFVGFGENGHIAFNDPHAADFSDPFAVKRIALDEECRRQQVGEGHFASLAAVPREAATLTCTALMRAGHWICCVPELRKARAVKCALEGPVSPRCPASLARVHPSAFLYLDRDSASLLSPELTQVSA
jgi:glucosamine-6-phosphate deaminase